MIRTKSRNDAAEMAQRDGKLHGLCVFDGLWYIGTAEELRKVGAVVGQTLTNQPLREDAWTL